MSNLIKNSQLIIWPAASHILKSKSISLFVLNEQRTIDLNDYQNYIDVIPLVVNFVNRGKSKSISKSMKKAKANNVQIGRPPALTENDIKKIRVAVTNGETKAALAKKYSISRTTLDKYLA